MLLGTVGEGFHFLPLAIGAANPKTQNDEDRLRASTFKDSLIFEATVLFRGFTALPAPAAVESFSFSSGAAVMQNRHSLLDRTKLSTRMNFSSCGSRSLRAAAANQYEKVHGSAVATRAVSPPGIWLARARRAALQPMHNVAALLWRAF